LGLLRYFYLFILAGRLAAQSIAIHSEFQRINPFGEVVSVDRSEFPREILSPEIPRNAHSFFHVAVTVPENTSYFLYVGSNPSNVVETSMYKEDFAREGNEWIPDALSPIQMPAFGFMPDSGAGIRGQTTRCYLLDIWAPPQADVRRVRVEVLMKIGTWYVAPMEVRIGEARVPAHTEPPPKLISSANSNPPNISDPIDLSPMECLAAYLLGRPQTWTGGMRTVRDAVRLTAEQDMAVARQHRSIPQPLWFLAENGILQWRMRTPAFNWSGAEWYLRVQDWIYRNVQAR